MKKILILLFTIYSFASFAQTKINTASSNSVANINNAITKPITASGTDTYTATVTNLTWATDEAMDIKFTNANTGSSTFQLNGGTVYTLKKLSSGSLVNLASGDISAGERKRFYNDGTYLVIEGGSGSGGTSGLVIGTTTVTSGTNTRIPYNNAGVLGEYNISGSGSVAMTTNGVFTTPNLGAPSAGDFTSGSFTWPTFNQNTTGSAATVTTTINSGVVATTQSAGDNSTKVATTAYTDAKVAEAITNGVTGIAPSEDQVFDALALKQATLVSGTNIKTVNGSSLLGSGDVGTIDVAHGGTNATSASITAFNNITGYTASGATGTTSTNLVFSTGAALVNPTVGTQSANDNSTKAASTAYADAKVADAINDGTTTIAPSENAVFDALALKLSANPTLNTQTGTSYTLVLGDANKIVFMSNASANTITIPPNSSVAFPLYTLVTISQTGVGQTDVVAGSGVTINTSSGFLTSPGQDAPMTIYQYAIDSWKLWDGSPIISAALTSVNDTNITCTLGGSPNSSLLAATSLTFGWTGSLAASRGGTGLTTYAVGDLIYASATTPTLSKLADVAVGSYLRSGGVNTAPLWSTLILPNAATSGRIVFASATNTYGEDADFTVTGGDTFVATKLNSTSLTFSNTSINTTSGDGATINASAGRFRKDSSGTTFTLTNSFITANSIIQLTAVTAGLTGGKYLTVQAASGSAVITFEDITTGVATAPSADFDINFVIIN